MANICPHCGQTIRAARKPKPLDATGPVDTSKLSTGQLFAHYKTTAPNVDAEFFLNTLHARLIPEEQATLARLATDKVTDRREHYRELTAIQDAWRRRKDPAADAAFAHMRAQWTIIDSIREFKRKRNELREMIDEAVGESRGSYYGDKAYSLVRSVVSRARSCYPRVFAHAEPMQEREVA